MDRWTLFFRIAALFNFGAAGALLFAPDLLYQILQIDGSIAPDARLYSDGFAVMAGIFGLAYWWAADDPPAHRDLIWLGVFGKPAAVTIIWYHVLFQNGPLGLGLLISLDLVFAGVFLIFLRQYR